jgi:hypothetical protein
MKVKSILVAAIAAIGLVHDASADATINVTGATAFRGAAVNTIKNSFTSVNFAFTGSSVTGGNQQLFIGSFPGITGTTTVRTFWSGSTEGARDVVQEINTPARFLDPATTTVSAGGTQITSPNLTNGVAKMYFTDVGIENTAYSSDPDATTLQPADSRVGAIVFSFLKNKMLAANPKFASYGAFTNMSSQQFRALFSPVFSGRILLSQFTGSNTDDDTFVYATGRNDLSGTRTAYMVETGYGAPNLVTQWKIASTSNNMTSIQIWPLNDNTPPNDNRSLQWNLDTPGNGGYFTGGAIRDLMDDTSNSVTLLDDTGATIDTNQNVIMVTWLGNSDASTAISNGAVALSYNGVGITPNSGGLSAADKAKIQNGTYTAWTFERFYRLGNAKTTVDERTFFSTVFGNISANIGSAGLTMTEMTGVDRATDGATVFITP